jgi:hypothetical protein
LPKFRVRVFRCGIKIDAVLERLIHSMDITDDDDTPVRTT